MKNLILSFAMAVLLITACNTDKTKGFIAGTYVSSGETKYSVSNDTLVIDPSTSNNYLIHRKTGFNIVKDGKKGKRQYETEEWRAVYDEGTKSLMEVGKGKLITFYPDENRLAVGERAYKKLN